MADKPNRNQALRRAVLAVLEAAPRPMHAAQIAKQVSQVRPQQVRRVLEGLIDDRAAAIVAGGRYTIAIPQAGDAKEVTGSLTVHPRGFAFVRCAEGDDVFIPAEALGGAMHRDTVRAKVSARTERGLDGEIVEVLERGLTRVVGELKGKAHSVYLVADDGRVRSPIEVRPMDEELFNAAKGKAVVIELIRFPETINENPKGKLLQVLGKPGEPTVEVHKILAGAGIEEAHPQDALDEAETVPVAFKKTDPDAPFRTDLTHIPLLAIDPKDARDHDDAVHVRRRKDGHYEATIAVADVSHAVGAGTAIDREARKRGNSVYLPDRAIPMLPPRLATRVCSLLPGQPRRAMVVQVELSPEGEPLKTEVMEAVVTVAAFLTYDAVARALGHTSLPEQDPEAEKRRPELRILWDVTGQLRKRRMRKGSLNLEVPEVRVDVDEETGAPVAVEQRGGDPGVKKAYRIVEELMLLANEAAARFCIERNVPSVYRVHPPPDDEKLALFSKQCSVYGLSFPVDEGTSPKALSKFLQKVEAHDQRGSLHQLLLRSLQQASYSVNNIGHFGLASDAYLHFTSPIRRYTDLVVHRLIRNVLRTGKVADDDKDVADLAQAASHCSNTERTATQAERDVKDLYRALFMRRHVGEEFEANVVSFGPAGVYARIDKPFVDVVIPLDALGNDRYEIDELNLFAVGMRRGNRIGLGDALLVTIEEVDLLRRNVVARRIGGDDRQQSGRKEARKERSNRKDKGGKAKGGKKDKGRKGKGGKDKGPKKAKGEKAKGEKAKGRKAKGEKAKGPKKAKPAKEAHKGPKKEPSKNKPAKSASAATSSGGRAKKSTRQTGGGTKGSRR